jgi:hypothetical protein
MFNASQITVLISWIQVFSSTSYCSSVSWRWSAMQPLSRDTRAKHFTIHDRDFHLTINSRLALHPALAVHMSQRRCWHSVPEWSTTIEMFLGRRRQIVLFLTVCRLPEVLPEGGTRSILVSLREAGGRRFVNLPLAHTLIAIIVILPYVSLVFPSSEQPF